MDDRKKRFEESYRTGNKPWDIGRPDFNLKEILKTYEIPRGRALEIGCGTGDNAIFLAKNGFEVTATEIVDQAITEACKKAEAKGGACRFVLEDILRSDIQGSPFSFVFDRGCFHSFDSPETRRRFAQRVFQHLEPGGYWLSLIGNADEDRQGPGPPQRTAREITEAVEPFFEIILLKSGHFDSNMRPPPRNWVMLARRR